MSKAIALNFAALTVTTTDADKRSITSETVARPTRDIIANLNEAGRKAAWQGIIQTVADMHGKPVEAKGANWDVNDDEAARALRVNYNLVQPDFFPSRKVRKMDKAASRELWTQICTMLEKPEPTFKDDSNDSDND